MVTAGPSSSLRLSHGMVESVSRSAGSSVRGMAPTVATSQLSPADMPRAMSMAAREEGMTACHFLGHTDISAITSPPSTMVFHWGAYPSLKYSASF